MTRDVERKVELTGKARLRHLIKEGARRNADRDLKLVEEWFGVDKTPARTFSTRCAPSRGSG